MTGILIITNKIYDLLKQTEIKNIVLIPDTGQGLKYKKIIACQFFKFLAGHTNFDLPFIFLACHLLPFLLFDEIVLCFDFQ